MGYQISYDSAGKMERIPLWHKRTKYAARVLVLMIATMLIFLNVNIGKTLTALESMATEIQQGSSLKEAFSELCLDILQEAEYD